jgi:hypothetical protein
LSDLPEYIRTMVVHKPVEMIEPRKVAYLILLQRGWSARGDSFAAPERFTTLQSAVRRHRDMPSAILRVWNPSQALADWRRLGVVKTVETFDCRLKRRCALTPKGADLLSRIDPEVMRDARELVRVAIWTHVLGRRRARCVGPRLALVEGLLR